MNETVDFTIIVPCYNSEKSLVRLLNSIGTYPGLQVIVIDDCSPDRGIDRVREQYPTVEFYSTQVNSGAGACRNIGLSCAKGSWLLFADSDDWFCPGYYDCLMAYRDSSADIVYFVPTSIYEDNGLIADRHIDYQLMIMDFLHDSTKQNENKLRYKFSVPWSKMIRKEMVDRNAITFEEVCVSNDALFSVKCGYYAKQIDVDEHVIYCVTRNRGSLTTRADFTSTRTRLYELAKVYNFLRQYITEKELKDLEWRAGGYLFMAIQNRYRILEIIDLMHLINKYRLPVWDKAFILKSIRMLKKQVDERRFKE